MAKKAAKKTANVSVDGLIGQVMEQANNIAKREWTTKLDDEQRELVFGLRRKVLDGEVSAAPVAKILHEMIGGDSVVKRGTLEKWLRRS